MASQAGFNRRGGNNVSSSVFRKTVCLHDWWLIKAEKAFEGKQLAVAGFTSKEQRPVRVFSSAPIVNRYDIFTLETADGICVFLKGFINKLRSNENGFPSSVFSHFVFGFPPDWEEYAAKLLERDFSSDVRSESTPDSDEFETRHVGGCAVQNSAAKHTPNCGNITTQGSIPARNKDSAWSSVGCVNRNQSKDFKKAVDQGESSAKEQTTRRKNKKISLICPESLSTGRSRSGRLLMPTLEFWRNQLPVYDANRKLTGIKDEAAVIGPSRGSGSEPQKKRRL